MTQVIKLESKTKLLTQWEVMWSQNIFPDYLMHNVTDFG